MRLNYTESNNRRYVATNTCIVDALNITISIGLVLNKFVLLSLEVRVCLIMLQSTGAAVVCIRLQSEGDTHVTCA